MKAVYHHQFENIIQYNSFENVNLIKYAHIINRELSSLYLVAFGNTGLAAY